MKFDIGDSIVVKITDEEGKVVDIINENMLMIEVKGVKFPAYIEQLDFPYFKWFSEKKTVEKPKLYIDQVKKEKVVDEPKEEEGVILNFLPVFSKDVFDDDVVERLKVYLINQTKVAYKFQYKYNYRGKDKFELTNAIEPFKDFYLHDVDFEDLSDSPRFDTEFSLKEPQKGKAPYYETSLKLKPKQVFKKIEDGQINSQPTFGYLLFDHYPNGEMTEEPAKGLDLSALNNTGFRVYDASKVKQNLDTPRSVVDLHIDKIINSFEHLSNFEIMSLQLSTFEKYYDLAIAHKLPSIIFIHGVGEGKLKAEIHQLLKFKQEVKNFVATYSSKYGQGATEVFFK